MLDTNQVKVSRFNRYNGTYIETEDEYNYDMVKTQYKVTDSYNLNIYTKEYSGDNIVYIEVCKNTPYILIPMILKSIMKKDKEYELILIGEDTTVFEILISNGWEVRKNENGCINKLRCTRR